MVSCSNGGVSGEVLNKRTLENGNVQKYKPRKVSAIRNFPPRCGPNVAPADLKPEENGSSGVSVKETDGVKNPEKANTVVANGGGTSGAAETVGNYESANLMEAGGVEAAEMAKLHETKSSGLENALAPIGIQDTSVEVESQLHEIVVCTEDVDKSFGALKEKVGAAVNDVVKLGMEIGPLQIQLHNGTECPTQEAIKTPGDVKIAEPLNTLVGEVTTTMDGVLYDVAELKTEPELVVFGMLNDTKSDSSKQGAASGGPTMSKEITKVETDGLASVQNSGMEETESVLDVGVSADEELLQGNSQALSMFCGSIKPETIIRPKDKYRRRRVSAVRDFPPHCGSVPLANTIRNDCLDRLEKVEVESEPSMTSIGSDKGSLAEIQMSSQNECLVGLDSALGEKKTVNLNDSTSMMEGIVEGSHKGQDDSNIEKSEARQAVPGSGAESNAVLDDSIDDTGGTLEKNIAVHSPDGNDKVRPPYRGLSLGNELHREVVHGLMAAPHCPWRKSSPSLNNNSSCKSGGRKVKSRPQKFKAVALDSDLRVDGSGGPSMKKTSCPDSRHADGTPSSLSFMEEENCGAEAAVDNSDKHSADYLGKEIVVFTPGEVDREVVHDLMAASHSPRVKGKVVLNNSDGGKSGDKEMKKDMSWRKKAKVVAKKSNPKGKYSLSEGPSKKQKKVHVSNDLDTNAGALVPVDGEGYDLDGDLPADSPMKTKDFDVTLPPFGPNSNSSHGDARHQVRETLRLFHAICRKILQQQEASEEEGNSKQSGKKPKRIDLMAAKIIKDKGKEVNTSQQFGAVPGVEVGDEFQYRVELAIVGIHRLYQNGIDSMKVYGKPVATSIVSSGAYADDVENADVLIYSGQGGNVVGKSKEPEDQKLERGNLALRNSITAQRPVRVVRGWKETKMDPTDSKQKLITTYVYDGLYTVKNYWTETGPHGKQVFKFELRRNPGQPELAWKELKRSSKSKIRPGVCVNDISGGKDTLPICAVNTIDDEKPPPFNYTPKMIYPDWHHPVPPAGCDCTGRCSDSKKCRCAVRNGGEIPYNRNGAIVESKLLVYECGPHCKCPPTCYNRVTQRGIKLQLEIFKTKSRGWGVRAVTSIPSGSFVCEYAGELLEDKEAEQKIGNDEYLFDIGHNYNDSSAKPEEEALAVQLMEESGYTIDAGQFGNVGRFVNHSCSPNLYAQYVIYDHDDKKMPHVMLFAMENIPPLQELTYDYNYTIGQIRDINGNVKVKNCYCGSAECSGRLY